MCLLYNKEKTNQFLEEHKTRKTVTVYKVYEVKGDKLLPVYYKGDDVKPGVIKSNRQDKKPMGDKQDIKTAIDICMYRGIHVFLIREEANTVAAYHTNNIHNSMGIKYVVVPVRCYLSELCGVNEVENEAVFMSINISKKAYQEGIKRV